MDQQKVKKSLKRCKPNKKWSDEDIKKILNYLQDAPEIEAPTAQIFYKKLIEMDGIDATWELIRWKVRHLKASFKKANDWRQSTGAGLLASDAETTSVEGKILQMCPHYKQLNQIFGEKNVNGDFVVVDSGNINIAEDEVLTEVIEPNVHVDIDYVDIDNSFLVEEIEDIPSPSNLFTTRVSSSAQTSGDITQSVLKKGKDFAEKLKKNAPKSSAAHLAAFQADRTEMFKIRLEWEKEKHEKEIKLSDRKLKLEEEKVKDEINFKVLQLEKEEKFKILQLEKEERVQKFEIEMKYKCQTEK